MIRDIWPDVTADTQPFYISTPAGDILEMPDTGALADYVSAQQMADHIIDAISKLDQTDRYVHIGFHQETADKYIERVIEALLIVKATSTGRIIFETLEKAALSI
jgi:hypothetical protein